MCVCVCMGEWGSFVREFVGEWGSVWMGRGRAVASESSREWMGGGGVVCAWVCVCVCVCVCAWVSVSE